MVSVRCLCAGLITQYHHHWGGDLRTSPCKVFPTRSSHIVSVKAASLAPVGPTCLVCVCVSCPLRSMKWLSACAHSATPPAQAAGVGVGCSRVSQLHTYNTQYMPLSFFIHVHPLHEPVLFTSTTLLVPFATPRG